MPAVHLCNFPPFLCPVEDVGDQVLENRCIELVSDTVAVAFCRYHVRIAKNREMTRNGRPRTREMFRNLAGRERSLAKHLDNLTPCGVGQRLEDIIRNPHGLVRWSSCIIS